MFFEQNKIPVTSIESSYLLSLKRLSLSTDSEPILTRTEQKLLEYKQFKAARLMQSQVRGWLARRRFQSKREAVVIIQRFWLRFSAHQKKMQRIEQLLQCRTKQKFQNSAIKIQTVYRGWWVRNYINDMNSLKRAQKMAFISLIISIAYKLHHLLRVKKIPGIYTLRNSDCLKNVEHILGTLSYRFHNDNLRVKIIQQSEDMEHVRRIHVASRFQTAVPYGGPNYMLACRTAEAKDIKLYERRITRIIKKYDDEKQRDKLLEKIKRRKEIEIEIQTRSTRKFTIKGFCGSVIDSMKRWNIWNQEELQINDNVFDTPENVVFFLNEVQSLLDVYERNCHCDEPEMDCVSLRDLNLDAKKAC